jgi:hypothetical protein
LPYLLLLGIFVFSTIKAPNSLYEYPLGEISRGAFSLPDTSLTDTGNKVLLMGKNSIDCCLERNEGSEDLACGKGKERLKVT